MVDQIYGGTGDSLGLIAASERLDIYAAVDAKLLPSFTGPWWPALTPPSPEKGRQETSSLAGPTLFFGGDSLDYADTALDSQLDTLPADFGLTQELEAISLPSNSRELAEANSELLAELEAAGFSKAKKEEVEIDSSEDCTESDQDMAGEAAVPDGELDEPMQDAMPSVSSTTLTPPQKAITTNDLKEMQKEMNVNIKAPKCFCGLDAKMRKCMTQDQTSKAFGVMFWWCNKDKWDEDGNEVERCKFARRVDQGRARVCTFWRETGSCKKGSECSFAHDIGGELTWKGKDGSHHSESKEKKEGVKGVGEEEEEEEKVVEKVEGVGVEVESEKDKGEVEESDSSSSSSSSDSDSDSDSDDSSVLSSSSSSSDEK